VTFARLARDWTGRSVFLLGGGPSLRGFDFERLRGRGVVIAINDAIRAAPWADCAVTIDTVWLRNRAGELADFMARGGEVVAAVPEHHPQDQAGIRYLSRRRGAWLSQDADSLHTGENSGFAALGMAIMRGAGRIALLGYDMNGPGHFHAGYAWHCRYGAGDYPRWARMFSVLAHEARLRKIDVVNCNPNSAVRAFRFGRWEDMAE
jgi:hypothetical protein